MYTLRSQPQQPVPRHGLMRAQGHNCGRVPGTVQRRESFDLGTLKRVPWMEGPGAALEPGAERQNWAQDSACQQ